MKAYILLDGNRDHTEPWDYDYCKQLAEKLDPEGTCLKIEEVEE